MKITATSRCQLDGRIYDVGETLDYDGAITSRIAHNFKAANGAELVVGKDAEKQAKKPAAPCKQTDETSRINGVLAVMNREQLMAKLDERGITYKPTHKNEYLAKLYLQSIGELD